MAGQFGDGVKAGILSPFREAVGLHVFGHAFTKFRHNRPPCANVRFFGDIVWLLLDKIRKIVAADKKTAPQNGASFNIVLVLTRLSAVIFRTLSGLVKFYAFNIVQWKSIGGQHSVSLHKFAFY